MTDRSKNRIFKNIELLDVKDLATGLHISSDRLIEKFCRVVAPTGQVITTTPSTVLLGSVLEAHNITIINGTDVQVDYTDVYDFSCIISAKSGAQNQLFVWVETLGTDGSWTPFPLSGRRQSFSNNNEGDVEFSTKITLNKGTVFRFRAKSSSGTITLGDDDIDTGNGVVGVPAVVLSLASI